MDIYQVLIRPLVTEKGTHLATRRFEGRGDVQFRGSPEPPGRRR